MCYIFWTRKILHPQPFEITYGDVNSVSCMISAYSFPPTGRGGSTRMAAERPPRTYRTGAYTYTTRYIRRVSWQDDRRYRYPCTYRIPTPKTRARAYNGIIALLHFGGSIISLGCASNKTASKEAYRAEWHGRNCNDNIAPRRASLQFAHR